MAKVYLVTSGEYSDYSVDAVFSTEALAKEWIGDFGQYTIEERDIDSMDCQPVNGLCATVHFDAAGTVDLYACGVPRRQAREPIAIYADRREPTLAVVFDHDDRERALKVCSEIRAHFIALHGRPVASNAAQYFNRDTLQKERVK